MELGTDIRLKRAFTSDVDGARKKILRCLRKMGDKKIIYYNGWDGFGTSAVLRSIAEELSSSKRTVSELCFDRMIHIDCSDWKSRRVMQRTIAEQLELSGSVMAMFDKQDEEDDFNAVVESSRNEIRGISRKIHETLYGRNFVVIFYNGSDDEIDLNSFGVPSFDQFSNNRMIWTFKKRQLTIKEDPELVHKLRYTHLLVSSGQTKYLTSREFYAILCKEAAIILDSWPCLRDINPVMVANCWLYDLFLHCGSHNDAEFYWTGHAFNFWICEGILQGDRAWEISNVLNREIKWDYSINQFGDILLKLLKSHSFLVRNNYYGYDMNPLEPMDEPCRRILLTISWDIEWVIGMMTMQAIPPETSSFFLAFEEGASPLAIASSLFEHSRRLSVLVLSRCAFSFATPPFLQCHRLRFLGLDHCEDNEAIEEECHTWSVCLNNIWVLDIRYTHWDEILSEEKMDFMTGLRELNIEGVWCWQYISQLQGRVPSLRTLRIIKPTHGPEASIDTSNSFLDKTELEILDLSGNTEMKLLPSSLSKVSSLQVLVLDGCDGLENVVVPDGLPHLLRSFSFDGYGPASQWTPIVELPLKHFSPPETFDKDVNISKISLEGCTQLDNLFLRGLPNLVELDLSGTSIKILDFTTMVVEVPRLKRLFLLGCEHLHAIRWNKITHNQMQPKLKLLCIDTRAGIECPRPSTRQNKPSQLQVHAIFEDAKLARSLWYPINLYGDKTAYFNIHIISPIVYSRVVQLEATCKEKISLDDQVNLRQLVPAGWYRDVLSMADDAPMQAFPQPPHSQLDRHVEIAEGGRNLESELHANDTGNLGSLMNTSAESLHVHDISTSASMPAGTEWTYLRRCHVERCSKLDTVFSSESYGFYELETIWLSHLLMARWIFSKGFRRSDDTYSFRNLQHLHLRFCPRLQFVLPVYVSSFPNLETLHIIHCGDLRHVFVLDGRHPKEISIHGVSFPKLTTIHLHDLPMLRQICEFKMVGSALETIKIRGCWGLRRLPVVARCGRDKEKPVIEIEKDIWDALEWDGVEADHHPSNFKVPIHSRYYKKKLPRVSFLR